MDQSPKKEILMVCTGNICRSPMAEYILRKRLETVPAWTVSSAGVFAENGHPASAQAVDVLKDWSLDGSPHRSRQLTREMAGAAALIVVMTQGHYQEVIRAYPEAVSKTKLMMSFGSNTPQDVMDPYGAPVSVYRTIRDQIDSGIADLVLYLIEQEKN